MRQIHIFAALIAVSFVLIVGLVIRYTGATDVTTTAEILNEAPAVDTLRFSATEYGPDDFSLSGILPTINSDTIVHVTGIVSDANGGQDIATTSVHFYRAGVQSSCVLDKNNCYEVLHCDITDTANTTEQAYDCPFSLAFFTDATDNAGRYPQDTWRADVTTTDIAGSAATSSATVEVNSLLALNLPDAINYGIRSLGEQSTLANNVTTLVAQRGNNRADVEIFGNAMGCDVLGSIPAGSQYWSTTNTAYGAASNQQLLSTPVRAGLNIPYRDNDTEELARALYWNIAIPSTGVKGNCSGANTISIISLGSSVFSSEDVMAYAGAWTDSVFMIAQGTLWATGSNSNGELGLGDQVFRSTFTQIGTDTNWKQVSAGESSTIALKTDGTARGNCSER